MQEMKHQQSSSGDVLFAVPMENARDTVSCGRAVRGSEAEGNLSLRVSFA